MSSPHTLGDTLGWFGKIPALGDFVTRGLPVSFVEPWDRWLASELTATRAVLTESWAIVYRQAPISCFSLNPGVIDERTWHGILVPSFDRVGREFPLTIARSESRHGVPAPSQQWWAALVTAGRRALERGCDAGGVDEALAVLRDDAPTLIYAGNLGGPTPAPASVDARTSTWWRWLSEPATADTCAGLPRGALFRKLLAMQGACKSP